MEDRQEEVTSDPGGCFSPHTQSAFMHYSYTSQPGAVSIQISCDGPPPSPVLGLKRKICLVPLLDLAALEDQLGGKREGFGFNMQKDKRKQQAVADIHKTQVMPFFKGASRDPICNLSSLTRPLTLGPLLSRPLSSWRGSADGNKAGESGQGTHPGWSSPAGTSGRRPGAWSRSSPGLAAEATGRCSSG